VKIIKVLLAVSFGFMLMFGAPAQADVREVYVCDYLDGKDMDDILLARDYYLKQSKKAGLTTPDAFVWNHFKGSANADVIWFNNYTDMMDFAKQSDAAAGSSEMASVNQRFDTIVDCTPGLASRETVYDSGDFTVTGGSAIISSNACMLNDGVTSKDLDDLWSHAKSVLSSMDEYNNFLFFASTPVTRGVNSADLYLYGVSDNLTAWAKGRAAFGASDAGQSLSRHLQVLMNCTADLWIGQQVVGGE